MTFLQLCQRLRQEAGYSGTGPTDVVNQSGDSLRFVTWINDAYFEIQQLRRDWSWMRSSVDLTYIASDNQEDLPSDFLRFDEGSVVLSVTSNSTRWFPDYLEPNELRYLKREQDDNGGIPKYFSASSGICEVFPTPDEEVSISGDYFYQPVKMSITTDVPRIPDEYQMGIVWYALMMYAAYDEAGNTYQHAASKWTQIFNDMNMTQLPKVETGGALA